MISETSAPRFGTVAGLQPFRGSLPMPSILKSLIVMLLFVAGIAHAADAPQAGGDPSIDHAFMDLKADPCGNFFRYACGGWIDANPIPADQSSWGLEQVLMQQNQQQLRLILERAMTNPTPETQKIGDFYATCMDEAAIEKRGLDPLKPDLDRISALTEKGQLPALTGRTAPRRRREPVQLRRRTGRQGRGVRNRHCRPGRHGAARSRLLSENRSGERQTAR
jgi:hypothetical protein